MKCKIAVQPAAILREALEIFKKKKLRTDGRAAPPQLMIRQSVREAAKHLACGGWESLCREGAAAGIILSSVNVNDLEVCSALCAERELKRTLLPRTNFRNLLSATLDPDQVIDKFERRATPLEVRRLLLRTINRLDPLRQIPLPEIQSAAAD